MEAKISTILCPQFERFYWIHALRRFYEFGSVRPSVRPFFITAFFSGLAHYFFLYFAWSWGTISTQNWRNRIFFLNSCFPEKVPKIAQNGQICPFVCCFFLYFAWRWGTISNWRSRFFLGKFSLAQNQVKMSKMAQFVHLSVTTAFFSGLAHTLGRIWLAAFVFIYLCIARIFVTDTKSIYNTIQYNT